MFGYEFLQKVNLSILDEQFPLKSLFLLHEIFFAHWRRLVLFLRTRVFFAFSWASILRSRKNEYFGLGRSFGGSWWFLTDVLLQGITIVWTVLPSDHRICMLELDLRNVDFVSTLFVLFVFRLLLFDSELFKLDQWIVLAQLFTRLLLLIVLTFIRCRFVDVLLASEGSWIFLVRYFSSATLPPRDIEANGVRNTDGELFVHVLTTAN